MWLVVAKANWRKGPVCAELAHHALPMSITRVRGCSPDLGACSWVGGRVSVAGTLRRRLAEPPPGKQTELRTVPVFWLIYSSPRDMFCKDLPHCWCTHVIMLSPSLFESGHCADEYQPAGWVLTQLQLQDFTGVLCNHLAQSSCRQCG